MSRKNRIFIGITLFYIAYLVFPIFSRFLQPTIPGLVVSFSIFVLFPKKIIGNPTFKWLFVYIIATLFFFLFGRNIKIDIGTCTRLSQLIIEYAFILPSVLIAIVLINNLDGRVYQILGVSTIVLICLSFIIVLPQLHNVDLRRMARAIDSSEMGVGILSFSLLHAYIIIIPALFGCFVLLSGKLKYLFLLAFLLTSFIIIRSNITTTIVLLIIDTIVLLVLSAKRKGGAIFGLFVGIVAFFLFVETGTVSALLDAALSFFEGTAVEEKIIDFKVLLSTGTVSGGIGVREDLHRVSWNAFFDNLLWGGGYHGGHSSILDRLGEMGVVGFIPYIMIFVSMFKRWLRRINHYSRKYYFVAFFSMLVLLYAKGIFGQEGYLFFMVLLPVFLLLPDLYKGLSKSNNHLV